MGLALPAETNGYPGPRHVLELADEMALSPGQRARVERLFGAMRADAQRLGAEILEREAALDALFRQRRATLPAIEAASQRIGEAEAALKVVHARAHLAMMDILTPEQVASYVALRTAGGGTARTRPNGTSAEHDH